MNIPLFGSTVSTNKNSANSIFAGSLKSAGHGELKSTKERQQRIQKTASQVDFYEKQKINLKNMKCESAEEIAKKLDMFHNYEDGIAAAKMSYNYEQMYHMLEEAKEKGEKIAEEAEKLKPKTPEERIEDLKEEALGIDEGETNEAMEELQDAAEELMPELSEETESIEAIEKIEEIENIDGIKSMHDKTDESALKTGDAVEIPMVSASEMIKTAAYGEELELVKKYKPVDIRI